MEKGEFSGQMEKLMMVNTKTIKNMDLELLLGRMEENMLDNGRMVSSMVRENIIWLVNQRRLVNGFKGKEFAGFNE